MLIIKIIHLMIIKLGVLGIVLSKFLSRNKIGLSGYLSFVFLFALLQSSYAMFGMVFFPTEEWRVNISPIGFLLGPILYLFTLEIHKGKVSKKQQHLHFSPFYLLTLFAVIGWVMGAQNRDMISVLIGVNYLGMALSQLVYSILIFRWIPALREAGKYLERDLILLANVFTLTWSIMTFSNVLVYFIGIEKEGEIYNTVLVYLMVFVFLGYFLLYTVRVFKKNRKDITLPALFHPITHLYTKKENVSPIFTENSTDQALEHQRSLLNELMNKQELYLDPELSLDQLAKLMHCSKYELSHLFNQELGISFNTYINTLRVERYCQIMAKNSQQYSTLDVAYQSGFNSKSTFLRWFKKLKGVTPSEYKYNKIS